MEVVVVDSARRHGVPDAAMHEAIDNAIRIIDLEDQDLTLIIGGDHAGQLLEVGFREHGDVRIIVHAMTARAKWLDNPR